MDEVVKDKDITTVSVDDTQSSVLNQKWFQEWRTLVAWMYVMVCLYDFLVAPVFVQVTQLFLKIPFSQSTEWVPITLQGGGFFHLTMLGILGVSSFTKGQTQTEIAKNMPDYSNLVRR